MKLSRKIVNSMPTATLKDIEKREAAHEKLKEAEALVDRIESLHSDLMTKDQQDVDRSDLEGVVRLTTTETKNNTFISMEAVASNLGDVKHYKSVLRSAENQSSPYYRYIPVTETKMEEDTKHGRTTYSIRTQNRQIYGNGKDNESFLKLQVTNSTAPSEFLIVTGEGEDREFRFDKLGMFERLWESSVDLASGLARTVAPLRKKMGIPKFKIEVGE